LIDQEQLSPRAVHDFLIGEKIEVAEDSRSGAQFCAELTELGEHVEVEGLTGTELASFVDDLRQLRIARPTPVHRTVQAPIKW
jgi:hypothetical protein